MGLVTLSSFLFFWGLVFIFTTTLVAIFKHEQIDAVAGESPARGVSDVVNAYKQLYTIIKLPSVRTLVLVLFTAKVRLSLVVKSKYILVYNYYFVYVVFLCS